MRAKKSKKDSSANDKLDQLIAWHEERYSKWHHYREHGGSDPTWPDGSNMNLLRNHIISYKRQIKELCEANQIELPEEYHRLLPPEVCDDYMANTELIDENARKALGILESHPAYLELLSFGHGLSPKQKEKICFNAVVGYVSRLRSAIEKRDYVQMRCYSRHENYVDSFVSCLEKAKAMEPEQYQLSLFDISAYLHGLGVDQDQAKAIELLNKLSENSESEMACDANVCLSLCYLRGEGVDKSAEKSVEYLDRAELICSERNKKIKTMENEYFSHKGKLDSDFADLEALMM